MSSDNQKRAKQLAKDALYYESIAGLDFKLYMKEIHASVSRNHKKEIEFKVQTVSPDCEVNIIIPHNTDKEEILKIWSLIKYQIESDFDDWQELEG